MIMYLQCKGLSDFHLGYVAECCLAGPPSACCLLGPQDCCRDAAECDADPGRED